MPYPAQVQRDVLIDKARELIEMHGLDQLTLASLAASVGIAAPSLYHHFRNKTALLGAVNTATARALTQALTDALAQNDTAAPPQDRLSAMFHAYRAFVHAHPLTYTLLFSNMLPGLLLDAETAEALALPLQTALAPIVGADRALAALRGAWALVHGFVTLETGGQFQRGGDLDTAFQAAVTAYILGLLADS